MSAASGSTVSVVLNRDRLNGVTAPAAFETSGSFAVQLSNEGEPVHVHVRPEGRLAEIASVAESNQYVERGSNARVPVNVRAVSGPVTGELAVVTGHGTESHRVEVTVRPDDAASLQTDEPSDAPAEPSSEPTDTRGDASETTNARRERTTAPAGGVPEVLADPAGLLTVALVVGALVMAVVAQITLGSFVVTVGVFAVVVAAVAAGWILTNG